MICKCGCGKEIVIRPWHKTRGIPLYIKGHYWNGRKRPDTSELMKTIMKGRVCHWKGKNRPDHSKKISGKNHHFYGKKNPSLSKAITGEKHPNWKGGISAEPYCYQWLDKEYKESIKERDGYKCLNPECNKISNKICLHHIDYIKKNCHPFNLITICNSCNGKANVDREWHESWYNAIIYNRYIKSLEQTNISALHDKI